MKRRTLLRNLALGLPALGFRNSFASDLLSGAGKGEGQLFAASWDALSKYEVPDWFRDAKFGMWAHWGPQCQPEYGDWYARGMYQEGSVQYKYHLEKYGHPSRFGFKDVIHEWKAELFDPMSLVSLYKEAGAKYFVALANHHDNLDLYIVRTMNGTP